MLVSQVRTVLEDEAQEPRWIRTVQRFGYAFCGSATGEGATPAAEDAGAACWLSSEEGDFRLREGDNVLGRDAGVDVRVDRPGVSRRHACIRVEGGRATLTDLDSKNGTFVSAASRSRRPGSSTTATRAAWAPRPGRHAKELPGGREDDDAVLAPRGSRRESGHRAQRLRGAAGEVDLLHRSLIEGRGAGSQKHRR